MVDKNSSRYPEYLKECEALQAEFGARIKEVRERQKEEGYTQGLDNPEIDAVFVKTNAKLKEIMKRYGFD